jgi:hypothetical protein
LPRNKTLKVHSNRVKPFFCWLQGHACQTVDLLQHTNVAKTDSFSRRRHRKVHWIPRLALWQCR